MVVGKETLKLYDFSSIDYYFNYIVDSEINGNYSQMKNLFKKLSQEQKKDFIKFIREMGFNNIKVEDLF